MDAQELLSAARGAIEAAYVPYSGYRVGAALLTAEGTVFTGCNIENANYSNSIHAEEGAIAEAITRGQRDFTALAVVSEARDGVTPCGMCRQTLAEFCGEEFPIYCDEGTSETGGVAISEYRLGALLPEAISHDTLDAAREDRS